MPRESITYGLLSEFDDSRGEGVLSDGFYRVLDHIRFRT